MNRKLVMQKEGERSRLYKNHECMYFLASYHLSNDEDAADKSAVGRWRKWISIFELKRDSS